MPTLNFDPIDFAALINASAHGDRAAFLRLYDGTNARLLALVLRIVQSRPEAEDVLQDVYVTVWKYADKFDPELGSAWGWLVLIARNKAIDHVRSSAARASRRSSDIDDMAEFLSDGRQSETALQDRNALRRCLGGLEPAMRDLVVEAYILGLSREELAARHGHPVNTIKTWLQRSLSRLKQCLGD